MRLRQKIVAAVGAAALLAAAACSSSSSAGPSSSGGDTGTASTPAGVPSIDSGAASGGSATTGTPLGLTKDPATDGTTINVLMVNNPQMLDLQKMTGNNFTAVTGIKVNYTVLPENDMRNKASLDFKNQAGAYDVTTLSNFEVPIYAKNGWLADLSPYVAKDAGFNQSDIIPAMTTSLSQDNKVYGEPFYGESSFLMYRKDVFAAKGLTMPDNPTWQQVADLAAKADGAEPNMKGICLRGQPGWGQLGAPLTTMVNTFGGTWIDKDWNAQVNAQPFKDATNFYVNLVKSHGEVGASNAGFTECLTALEQSKVAMWYDATSAAGSLEASDSPVAGKIGYVQAPVDKTKTSGWLYTWAWLMEKASKHQDAAWQFISWASSQQYEQQVGEQLGWSRVPAGKRTSTYANADYLTSAKAFAQPTLTALQGANPNNPGLQARPAPGIQFVDIPEFTDVGDKVTALISAAIAGNGSVDDALNQGQSLTQTAADNYK